MALKSFQLANDQYERDKKRKERLQYLGNIVTKKQGEEFEDFLDIVLERQKEGSDRKNYISLAVAGFDRKGIIDVLNQSSYIITTAAQGYDRDAFRTKRFKDNSKELVEGYKGLKSSGLIDQITDPKAGTEIEKIDGYANLAGYQIHQSNQEAGEAIENIKKNNGAFVAFDLETTGGKYVGDRIYPGEITEFSFIRHNADGTDDAFTSIIGSTEEEDLKYRELFKKWNIGTRTYKNGGYVTSEDISEQEKVTLKRLAKMGSLATTIDYSKQNEGVFRFKTFAGSKDVAILDPRDIEEGIRRLREIGIVQEGLEENAEFQGVKVKGWEYQFLSGLQDILKKDGLTLAGQNSRTFDLPFINRLIASNKVSEGFKQVLADWGQGNKDKPFITVDKHLDMLPLLRQFLTTDFYSDDDLIQMSKRGLSKNSLEAVARRLTAKEIKDKNGNIIRDWGDTAYEQGGAGASHMAETDVGATIKAINRVLFEDTEDKIITDLRSKIIEAAGKDDERPLQKGSVLFARKSFTAQQYDLLQLMEDKLSGELRFMDSAIVDEEGEVGKQSFGQFGLQKHGLYEIEEIKTLDTGSMKGFSSAIRKIYPNMDIGQMAVIKFNPIVKDSEYHIRAQSSVYYVGNIERLTHALMDHTYYIGTRDKKGIKSGMTPYVEEQLKRMTIEEGISDENRKLLGTYDSIEDIDKEYTQALNAATDRETRNAIKQEYDDILYRYKEAYRQSVSTGKKNISIKTTEAVKDGYITDEFIEESSRKVKEEAAARLNREHDLKKDEQIIRYLEIRDELAKRDKNALEKLSEYGYTEEEIQEFVDKLPGKETEDHILSLFWQESLNKNPVNLKGNEGAKEGTKKLNFRSLFGYQYKNQQDLIYSETLSKQVQRIGSVEQNRDIIEAAIKIARSKAGNDDYKAAAYYYKQIMSAVEHRVQQKFGDQPEVLGWKNTGMLSYEFSNKFDIDLTGFKDLKPGTIATINLDLQPENIVKSIIRAGRENLHEIEDYEPASMSALLKELQGFLQTRSGGYQFKDIAKENIIKNNDQLAIASQKMMRTLQDARSKSPTVGHLKGTYSHTLNVQKISEAIGETSVEDFIKNIAEELPTYMGEFTTNESKNRQLVEKMTEQVIDEIIMPKSHDTTMDNLIKSGFYNKEEADALKYIRSLHREGVREYVSSIFNMVGNMGGQIGWNTETGKIWATFDGDNYDLVLPKEEVIDNQFQWQLGNITASQPIGFYEDNDYYEKRKLILDSKIGATVKRFKGLMDWHMRQAKAGDGSPQDHLGRIMESINEILRESPAMSYSLQANRANQFRFDFEAVYKNVNQLIGAADLNLISGKIKTDNAFTEVLLNLIEGKEKYNPEHPEHRHFIALNANVRILLEEAAKATINNKQQRKEFIQTILDKLNIDVKPLKHNTMGYIAATVGDVYTTFNGTKRDPGNIEDVAKIDITEILKKQQEYFGDPSQHESYKVLSEIEFGRVFTWQSRYLQSTSDGTGLGRFLETHFRLKAIHTDAQSLAAIRDTNIDNAIEELKEKNDEAAVSKQSISQVQGMTPEQGTTFMRGDVFDEVYARRNSIQKLRLGKTTDLESNRLLDLGRKQVLDARYDLSEGRFKYAAGQYVTANETIGHIPGFASRPMSEKAKYDGLLKFGFFDFETGQLVSEENVTQIIKTNLNLQDLQAMSEADRTAQVLNLLSRKFQASYYVQAVEANTLIKINEFAEKGMTKALVDDTGVVDKNVKRVIDTLGFHTGVAHDGEILTRLQVLDDDLIRSMGDIGGDFWNAAKGRYERVHGEALTDNKIENLLETTFGKGSFKENVSAFQEAIREERYGTTRLMDQIFRTAGVIDNAHNPTWGIISNFSEGKIKHGDINSVRQLLDETFSRFKEMEISGGKNRSEAGIAAAERTKELFVKYLLGAEEENGKQIGTVDKVEADNIIKIVSDKDTGRVSLVLSGDKMPVLRGLSDETFQTVGLQYLGKPDDPDSKLNKWLNEIGLRDEKTGERYDRKTISYKKEVDDKGNWTGKLLLTDPSESTFEARFQFGTVETSKNTRYYENSRDKPEAVKFSQRAITNLGNMRVGNITKSQIQTFLEKRAAQYGESGSMKVLGREISSDKIYQELIEPMESGAVVQSAAMDQITRYMFNPNGGGELLSGFLKEENGKLSWDFNAAGITKFVKEHNVGNGNIERGTRLVGSLLSNARANMGITTVNEQGTQRLLNVFNAGAAVAFNSGKISIQEAKNVGFEVLSLEDVITDTHGARFFDESLYSRNVIIDLSKSPLGEQIFYGQAKPNGPYLAISANPFMGEPGEYIEDLPNKPQTLLKSLKSKIEDYQAAMNDTGIAEEARQRKIDEIIAMPQQIRNAQFDVWNSNKGVTAEATRAYMPDASRNTSRAINIMGTEGVEVKNLGHLMDIAQERGVGISKLNIFGINLVEEARKGNTALQLNFSILSTSRMHKIYDKNFSEIAKAFEGVEGADEILNQIKATAMDIAQTEGVSGISAREPEQYPSSVSQRQVFFSDIAQDNEVLSELANAQLRKEDFDADAVTNSLHKEEAAITINGKVIRASVDSAMLSAIQRISSAKPDLGLSIQLLDKGAKERFENYAQSQIYIGAGEAQRFRYITDFSKRLSGFTDDYDMSNLIERQNQGDTKFMDQLAGKLVGDVKVDFSNTIFKTYMSPGEVKAFTQTEDMTKVLRRVYQGLVAGAIVDKEKYGEDFVLATGEVQRARLWEQLGEDAEHTLEGRAIAFSIYDKTLSEDLMSRSGFAPTGRVNRYIQSVYDITQAVFNDKNMVRDLQALGVESMRDPGVLAEQINMVGLMIQEGFMSPKNASEGAAGQTTETMMSEFVPKLERSFSRAFALGDNATESERAQVKEELIDVIHGIYETRKSGREMIRNPTLPTLLEFMEENGQYGIDYSKYVKNSNELTIKGEEAIRNFVDILVDVIGYNGGSRSMFFLATVGDKGNRYNMNPTLPKNTNHIPTRINTEIVNATAKDMGVQGGFFDEGQGFSVRDKGRTQREIAEVRQQLADEKAQRSTVKSEAKIESAPKVTKISKGIAKVAHRNGLLAAAVGVAGGLMISGFAGNPSDRPPKQYQSQQPPQQPWGNVSMPDSSLPPPPLNLAADSSWMYNQQYPLTLSDSGLTSNNNPPIIGYNINISGMSPKGEAAAQSAIGSALSQGMVQNSSINVAIHNNYQDTMSQYQVNRMIQTSMGF